MKKIGNIAGKVLVLGILCAAMWLLYDKLRAYTLADILRSIRAIPLSHIFLSFCLMVLDYLVLIGYDWLALRAIKKKISNLKVAFVSLVGQSVSLNFGALLGGTAIRYRIYSVWKFKVLDIVRLVFMLAVTFWVGAMGLAGVIFLFMTVDVPPELKLPISMKLLGAILLGFCALYLFVCYLAQGHSVRIFKKEFSLPPFKIAVWQTLVACADLVIAGGILYALLPKELGISFAQFLPSFVLAQITVVLTHVPGGIGVLEVIIMHLNPNIPTETLFAALLLFRVIYYIIPLITSALLLGSFELNLKRRAFVKLRRKFAQTEAVTTDLAADTQQMVELTKTVPPVKADTPKT